MDKRKKIFWLIIITILLELFVFNFRYFVVTFSDLNNKKITEFERLDKKEQDGIIQQQIIIPLNKQINAVKLNFKELSDKTIEVSTQFVDEGEKYTFKNYITLFYNKNFKNSEYFVLNTQGKCETMY